MSQIPETLAKILSLLNLASSLDPIKTQSGSYRVSLLTVSLTHTQLIFRFLTFPFPLQLPSLSFSFVLRSVSQ